MSTTTPIRAQHRRPTKADLIPTLVAAGKGSPRKLRDRKLSELEAMVAALTPAAAPSSTTLSVAEVAAQEGVTKAAVRRWVRVGHLRNVAAESQGRDLRIDAAELAAYRAPKAS